MHEELTALEDAMNILHGASKEVEEEIEHCNYLKAPRGAIRASAMLLSARFWLRFRHAAIEDRINPRTEY